MTKKNFRQKAEEGLVELPSFITSFPISYWDNFDKQLNLVNKIDIVDPLATPHTPIILGPTISKKGGILRVPWGIMDDGSLVHELAHLWHLNIGRKDKKAFERSWRQISENHYLDYTNYLKASLEDISKNGTLSYYALASILEDVAETTELVYLVNHPHINLSREKLVYLISGPPRINLRLISLSTAINGNPRFIQKDWTPPYQLSYQSSTAIGTIVPKIIRKTEILKEYGFISEREYQSSVERLKELNLNQN